jgi:hypothetical protein
MRSPRSSDFSTATQRENTMLQLRRGYRYRGAALENI